MKNKKSNDLVHFSEKLNKIKSKKTFTDDKSNKISLCGDFFMAVIAELVFPLFLMIYIGYLLDFWMKSMPFFIVLFFLLGIFISLKMFVESVKRIFNKRNKK